jgi:hypothetical protein
MREERQESFVRFQSEREFRGRRRERGCKIAAPNIWYQSRMILEACGSGGEMPLKLTMVAAANSMRGGGWPRGMKAAGVVMPLAAECGAMPRQGGDSGVMPPRGDIGVMPVQGGDGREGLSLL